MINNPTDTAAWTSIEDVDRCAKAVDAQIDTVLAKVMAQQRSAQTAGAYVRVLAPVGYEKSTYALTRDFEDRVREWD